MVRVAVLADSLYYRIQAGTSRYVAELVRRLQEGQDGIQVDLFSTYPQSEIDRQSRERHALRARSIRQGPQRLSYLNWHFLRWPLIDPILGNVDLVHTPSLLVPPVGRSTKLVVTVHDLAFLHYPECFGRWARMMMGRGLRIAVKEADHIIAVSDSTRRDLIEVAGAPEERVTVVYEAAGGVFKPTEDPGMRQATRHRYGIEGSFALFVGTLEPRKNLTTLLDAMSLLKASGRVETQLVIAGPSGWVVKDLSRQVSRRRLEDQVIIAGRVADDDLPSLMSMARLFVYPSLYEGFGLPVLEAMACGTAVVTSNTSSLPEIGGDAVLLIDPRRPDELARAIQQVWDDSSLRQRLEQESLSRAASFSWKRAAQETLNVYRGVAGSSS
jgi:glycosyltransferase involved in cell wall biosynthesis